MSDKPKAPKAKKDDWTPLKNLPKERLREIVLSICDGNILLSTQIPEDLLSMVFMPIALGGLAGAPKAWLETIGALYGDMKDALKMGVNGYPIFVNFGMINKHDFEIIRASVQQELARRKEIPLADPKEYVPPPEEPDPDMDTKVLPVAEAAEPLQEKHEG